MKNLNYLIIVLFLIFTGCSQKQVINVDKSIKSTNELNVSVIENNDDIIPVVDDSKEVFKLAVVYPSKLVGRYSYDMISTINTFFLEQKDNRYFEVEVFDSLTQTKYSLDKEFNLLKEKGYKKVIALITDSGLNEISNSSSIEGLTIYFPIINKVNYKGKENQNLYFGGLDYDKQIKKLLSFSNSRVVDLFDNSFVGNRLHSIIKANKPQLTYAKEIDDKNSNYKSIVNKGFLNSSSIFINTPIIKSSMLLSQIRANEITPSYILSTQINYLPMLFSLTQTQDRRRLIIANSIGDMNPNIVEKLSLLDIEPTYNYVVYSTLAGVDFLYKNSDEKLVKYSISQNQLINEVKLYRSIGDSFAQIK